MEKYSKVLSNFKIRVNEKLGSGGQGKVHRCTIDGLEGWFATKIRKAFNNEEISLGLLRETYLEFNMARNLDHPNIVEHKYAVKETVKNWDRYHIVMELIEGEDL